MISWAPEQINCGENQMWAKIEAETLSFFLVFLNISQKKRFLEFLKKPKPNISRMLKKQMNSAMYIEKKHVQE